MREEILHYIWENQYFNTDKLTTGCGKRLHIQSSGKYNRRDAGPDFEEAVITLDEITWAGPVEIHVKSSDWMRHGHQHDLAYANVILHVVYIHDEDIPTNEKETIPTLELAPLISDDLLDTIDGLMNQSDTIPCRSMAHMVPSIKIHQWLDRLAVDRLETKSKKIQEQLSENKGDWEATFIDLLCSHMGFKVNNDIFLLLAQKIDWRWIQKNAEDTMKLQAYFYGLAGFLSQDPADEYERTLFREFTFLKRAHGLTSLKGFIWKFSKMRPSNYPTVRIAHILALFHKHTQLFPAILFCKSLEEFYSYFEVLYPDYWQEHYAFGKLSKTRREKPGKMSIRLLLINVVTPVLYTYGKYTGNPAYCNRAVNLWQTLPPEKNRITRKWNGTKVIPESAWDSQALIHLYKNYCTEKRCLECQIGKTILREKAMSYPARKVMH